MTVRFDDDLAAEIEAVARIGGRTVTDVVREAIAKMIEQERLAPDFRSAVQRLAADNRSRLSRFERR